MADDRVAALPRQIAHPQLHGGAGDVRDDDAAAAVEQRTAGSLHADEAELVRLGRVQVRVPREHLQRPEAEEEHDEGEQRNASEDRDAQRELRCQAVRLDDARVGRQEAARRSAALLVRPGGHTTTSTSWAGFGAQLLTHEGANESVDGQGEDHVRDERRRERRHEDGAGDDLLAEEVVQDVPEGRGGDRDRGDGENRERSGGRGRSSRRSDPPRSPRA